MLKHKKKKVLIFWPSTSNRGRIAMSVPILSSVAKNAGWEVKYFDTSFYKKSCDSVAERENTGAFRNANYSLDMNSPDQLVLDFQKILNEFQPDLLAITGMTCDFQYMMSFFPKLAIPSRTIVAFGGIHSLHSSKEILESGMIDISCFGQAENILPEILKRIEEGLPLDGILGTATNDGEVGKIIINPMPLPLSPDKLWGFEPDYSFYDQRYYTNPFDGKLINMFWLDVGRGCPFSCTYCAAPQIRKLYSGLGKYVVSRPMDNIFGTIKNLQKMFNIDVFNITNECFLSQEKLWIEEFCERWGKEVKKSFCIQTRVETCTEERLTILRKSKAPIIQIGQGIESGSQRILLDICNRKMKIDDVKESYRVMRELGFRTNAYYMVGFPTETREEIFETIDLCKEVNSDIDSVSIFQPYPGLPLTEMCKKNGWITGNEILPSWTEESIINQPSISTEEVSNLRRVFILYAKLPKKYWSDIEKCEKRFEDNQDLFKKLVDIRWKLYS